MKRDADCSAFRPTEVHVPFIDWGTHQPSDDKACVMEAASWLAGEEWSDHPRSVHPVIARVARSVNDSLGVAERQRLWHLLLLSLDTARPYRPLLNWRLERLRRRTTRRRGDDPRELWELLLAEHARRTHRRPHSAYRAGLAGLEDQRRQRIAKDRANPVATQR